MSDHVNNGRDQLVRAPAPASSTVGPTRPVPPAAGPLTERKQNKRADGCWTNSSWMRLIQNRPMQQAACSLRECLARVHRYRPLL